MNNFVDIVIESLCNLNCKYCGLGKHSPDESNTINNLNNIFKSFDKEKTCFRVECAGEILLYKKIVFFLFELSIEGYSIEILTNGLLIEDFIHINSRVHWLFSLDGHNEKMNKQRALSPKQIDIILKRAIETQSELQCVYYKQNTDEINQFIKYLIENEYNGFLHIFPVRFNGKIIKRYIEYKKLIPADFLPPEYYFDRWKYMVENDDRNFQCDFISNGVTYHLTNTKVTKIKCDCGGKDKLNCNRCITHYEYNNSRKFLQIK